MTHSWNLRAASPADATHIAGHRYYRGEPDSDPSAYAAWLPDRMEAGTYLGFVAESAGQVVGGAGAVLLDWGPTRGQTSGTRARIVNVFTHPAWRRQGVAAALVRAVMEACTAQGVGVFSLAASQEAAPLYRSLGFQPYEDEMILRRQ